MPKPYYNFDQDLTIGSMKESIREAIQLLPSILIKLNENRGVFRQLSDAATGNAKAHQVNLKQLIGIAELVNDKTMSGEDMLYLLRKFCGNWLKNNPGVDINSDRSSFHAVRMCLRILTEAAVNVQKYDKELHVVIEKDDEEFDLNLEMKKQEKAKSEPKINPLEHYQFVDKNRKPLYPQLETLFRHSEENLEKEKIQNENPTSFGSTIIVAKSFSLDDKDTLDQLRELSRLENGSADSQPPAAPTPLAVETASSTSDDKDELWSDAAIDARNRGQTKSKLNPISEDDQPEPSAYKKS